VSDRPAILVIRDDDIFSASLRDAGIEVFDLNLIGTEPIAEISEFRKKLSVLSDYDGLFFTSPVAAEIFVNEYGNAIGFNARVYALGHRSREVLEQSGFDVISPPSAKTADELISSFDKTEFLGKRFLFIRGDKSLRVISEALADIADVDEVVVYRTTQIEVEPNVVERFKDKLEAGEIKLVCFFSPSGVQRFHEIFGDITAGSAAIGTTTAAAAKQIGLTVELISSKPDADQFACELIDHIGSFE
jgi:uroporphyrinogen-III synthase